MSGMWVSSRPRGWPRHGFEKRAGAIFFGVIAVFAAWFIEVQYRWDAMQRYYLAAKVVTQLNTIVLQNIDLRLMPRSDDVGTRIDHTFVARHVPTARAAASRAAIVSSMAAPYSRRSASGHRRTSQR